MAEQPRVRQHSLRSIAAHRCCLAGRAQLSHNVDPLRRAVHFRSSTFAACARRRRLRVRHRCLRCATTRCCCFVGRAQMSDNVDALRRAGAVSTIDLAARARWHRLRVCQGYLRCNSTSCCHSAGRAQMSHNVDSSRRAVQCRPSTSPPVHGGTAVVCARVTYDVPVLAVVVWWDERRCRTMSTRRGARCCVDHRCRRQCAVVPPSCAPRLPTMYQCSLLLFGGTRADVGQCRLVERWQRRQTSTTSQFYRGRISSQCAFWQVVQRAAKRQTATLPRTSSLGHKRRRRRCTCMCWACCCSK
jgi:hypothetical protein